MRNADAALRYPHGESRIVSAVIPEPRCTTARKGNDALISAPVSNRLRLNDARTFARHVLCFVFDTVDTPLLKVRSYPDEDDGNVAVNFWFRNVTFFTEEEQGLGDGLGSASGHSEL